MGRKPVMSTNQVWIRVIMLVGGLFAVVYAMKDVRNNSTLDAFFSPQKGAVATTGSLNLCPTRVLQIDVDDKRNNKRLSFHQKDSKWVVETDQKFELDPLFMEKWLGEFCSVKIDKFVEVPEGALPALAVAQEIQFTYIDGATQKLVMHGEEFTTSEGLVISEELTKAISKLNP